jgi:hypothetical protein
MKESFFVFSLALCSAMRPLTSTPGPELRNWAHIRCATATAPGLMQWELRLPSNKI